MDKLVAEETKNAIGDALQSAVANIGNGGSNGSMDPLAVLMACIPKLLEGKTAGEEERKSTAEGLHRLERRVRMLCRQFNEFSHTQHQLAEQVIETQQRQLEAMIDLVERIGTEDEYAEGLTGDYDELDAEEEDLELPAARPARRRSVTGVQRSSSKTRARTKKSI